METCKVMLKGDPTRVGYAIGSHILAIPDTQAPTGLKYQHMIEVGWMRYNPETGEESVLTDQDAAGFYLHDPKDLIFLGLASDEEYDDEEDEEDDEEGEIEVDDAHLGEGQ